MRILFVLLTLSVCISYTTRAETLSAIATKHRVALQGYDAVAFFDAEEATPGKGKFSLRHENATWYFSSASNRHTFKDNPTKYMPQFGGYSAFSLAQGKWVDGNPRFWLISDGKLYLTETAETYHKWKSNLSSLRKKASITWLKRFPSQ